MDNKFDSFSGLLRGALGDRLKAGPEISDIFTEDILFEFPYTPEGLPRRLEGISALEDHLARLGPMLELGEFTLHAVHPANETVVLEFSCTGAGVETGLPYNQDYISVVTLREGRIARYRDYWNPLVVLRTLGGAEAAAKAYKGETANG
ncbi:nuclear transport factor 2 family protein [Roseovarius atlanticus]|uniref:nuclear transport factor 2 family protein n=1 Tax=Roseovarius atlanticus TaxID=1641875 RepID=UPI001C93818C|nr:nuclear transport factor 2 family protein [Roseovarius atlanticus]MBY5986833.1 nuclear transport factor 2 family protein [Roseovarius atlanticus]MBY6125473.1 nuclear transport factor 2 family protein [Roseovarius atlanticus]MBY6150066.1 nuclear transport factor 2 family protein [Roseovarius atlanticus]